MRLDAWPNPTRAGVSFTFAVDRPGRVTLALFDLAGRRVASVADAPMPAGAQRLHWDGTDAGGERVAAGMYLAMLRVDGVVVGRGSVMMGR